MDSPDPVVDEEYLEQIIKAHQFLFEYLRSLEGAPAMMLRFAWNDAGTYDVETKTGGANGSIRNSELIKFDKYRELKKALQKCGEVKLAYPRLTYADIIQLAGIVAVEVTGGPYIEFVPGRKDSLDSPEEGRIPAEQGIIHLHWMGTFHRMGLSGKDIVALSGGLSLGRKEQERWGYDDVLQTPVPLKFNNSYFRKLLFKESLNQEDLPIHPADMALLQNPNFRHYVELYAKNEDAFFRDYAESHKKFSELGFTPKKSFNELVQRFLPAAISTAMVVLCYFFEFHRRVG